jgi:hypothetical protein
MLHRIIHQRKPLEVSYNPTSLTPSAANRQTPFPSSERNLITPAGSPLAAQELAAWLSALPSFFDLANHPLSDEEKDGFAERNYLPETQILRQVLRRCLHLCLIPNDDAHTKPHTKSDAAVEAPADLQDGLFVQPDNARPAPVWECLSELYYLCRALTETPKVNLGSWASLHNLVVCKVEELEPFALYVESSPAQALRRRLPDIQRMVDSVAGHAFGADVSSVLSSFAYSLEQLNFVGAWLSKDRPIKMTLPLFTHVHESARAAISTLEKMSLHAAEKGDGLYELFDSAGYAVGMELNKVFSRELIGLSASRHPSAIYTKVENAHGLLRDCLQQTIIAVAQAFDPTLDGSKVFDTQLTKLQQSLRLRDDLWALSELVRRAERDLDRKPLAPLVVRLNAFQNGAMRHLMYKDWESFERFVAEVTAARGAVELGPVLHRFATYLDALFNQISMRAVLDEHPFTYPRVAD